MPAKPPAIDAELVGVEVEHGTTNIAIWLRYPGTKTEDRLVLSRIEAATLHTLLGDLLAELKDHSS